VDGLDEFDNPCYVEPTEAYVKYAIDATRHIDSLTLSQSNEELRLREQKSHDSSVDWLMDRMKESHGRMLVEGKPRRGARWGEEDLPYIRGKVGAKFTDEWAINTPNGYFGY